MNLRTALIAGLSLVSLTPPAAGQTFFVSGPPGSQAQPVVPMVGCAPNVGCAGPVSASNPLPVTGSGGTVTPVPTTGAGNYSYVTIGTSDSTIVAASTAKVFLDLVSTSATATICVNLGATATISGNQCASGEITLPPLWHRSWENNFVPTDAVHAIASAASTPGAVGVK